jgi:sulfoxide reductase heme-binding subunit YedZ
MRRGGDGQAGKSPNRDGIYPAPGLRSAAMNLRKSPWFDYGGNFSPFKTAVFVSLFIPALWTIVSMAIDRLGARPLTEAIHQFGDWTIRLIFISLVISPARVVLQWPGLLQVRRMVGVAACVYILAHLLLYITDEAFDFGMVASEIVRRIYLTIGFTALIGLVVLAATSTDGWQRRLGARRWQSLHRIIYVIGFLAVIHFCMQSKLDEWEPSVMAGIYVWLMGCRAITWYYGRGKLPLLAMAGMSVAAWVLTMVCEALYYWWMVGAPFGLVLMANFSLDTGLRPSWVVLVSTGAVALLGTLRQFIKQRPKLRPA